jgi:hypothetical protein
MIGNNLSRMITDKSTLAKLKKFGDVFKAARERNDNESNTVMFLTKFFEEVLGYDSLAGEITKEIPIKDRFCDFAIVLGAKTEEGKPKPEFLVEAKAAGVKISTKSISNKPIIMPHAHLLTGSSLQTVSNGNYTIWPLIKNLALRRTWFLNLIIWKSYKLTLIFSGTNYLF